MAFDVHVIFLLLSIMCMMLPGSSHSDVAWATQSFLTPDTWYFQMVEPESLRYTYKMKPAKDFGTSMNISYRNIELVVTEPSHGCDAIVNDFFVRNNIALVERGDCSFLSKSIRAEEAGAIAIIIMDNENDNDSRMIDMIEDGTGRETQIPAFFVLGTDGYMIKKTLRELHLHSAIINIPVNATGIPIHALNQPPWSLW